MNLFVYGTLQRGYGNNRRLDGATFLGKAVTLTPYVLFNGGFPYAVPEDPDVDLPALPVMGEVYEVEDHHIEACDRLEGHPNWYQRKPILARVGEEVVGTYIYEMPRLDHLRYRLCNVSDQGYYYWSG